MVSQPISYVGVIQVRFLVSLLERINIVTEKQDITVKEIHWTDEARWLLMRRFQLSHPEAFDNKLKYRYNDEFIDRFICYECARKKDGWHVNPKTFTLHDGVCAYCEEEKPLADIMAWYWPDSYKSNVLDCVMDWWKTEYIANPGKYANKPQYDHNKNMDSKMDELLAKFTENKVEITALRAQVDLLIANKVR